MSLLRDCFICKLFRRRPGSPASDAEKALDKWDYAQANDAEVAAADPLYDQALAASKQSDPESAFAASLPLAEKGSAWAMVLVAGHYYEGSGVAVDFLAAENWDRRAAGYGSQRAFLNYLMFLAKRSDWATYDAVMETSEFCDWAPVLRRRATRALSRKNNRAIREQARKWLERAAAQGDMRAALTLAVEMARGQFGLTLIPQGLRQLAEVGGALSEINDQGKLQSQNIESITPT